MTKKGDADAKALEDEDSKVMSRAMDATNQDANGTQSQSIVSLSLAQWREIVEAYEVEQCDARHRTRSKFLRERNDCSQCVLQFKSLIAPRSDMV